MVKKSIVIVSCLILLTSCCDHYITSMEGLRSKRLYKKYLKERINPNHIGIDTNILYKSIDYKFNERNGNNIESITDPVALNRTYYLRFYSNGTYYSFTLKNNLDKIEKDYFNPKKGGINFVVKKIHNYYFMDYSPVNCGSFSKSEFKVKGDTLMISAGSNIGNRIWYYFLKHEVPKEWLDYEPDF